MLEQTSRSEVQVEPRPVLIYNKVSAVINESKNLNNSGMKNVGQEETMMETPVDKDSKTGNQVWYEYGCVWFYIICVLPFICVLITKIAYNIII